jgi:hypothetical protein
MALISQSVFAPGVGANGIGMCPMDVNSHITAVGPTQLMELLLKDHHAGPCLCVIPSCAKIAPIRRTRFYCCARAVSGHAVAPPSKDGHRSYVTLQFQTEILQRGSRQVCGQTTALSSCNNRRRLLNHLVGASK